MIYDDFCKSFTKSAEHKFRFCLFEAVNYTREPIYEEDLQDYINIAIEKRDIINNEVKYLKQFIKRHYNENLDIDLDEYALELKNHLIEIAPNILKDGGYTIVSKEKMLREFEIAINEWNKKSYLEKIFIRNNNTVKPFSLVGGWVLYIFFMCLAVIFYDFIWLWICITIIFLMWRHNEIKKYK